MRGDRRRDLLFDQAALLHWDCTAAREEMVPAVSSHFSHIRDCCNLWSRKPPPRWILEQVVCLGLTFLTDISHRHTVTVT